MAKKIIKKAIVAGALAVSTISICGLTNVKTSVFAAEESSGITPNLKEAVGPTPVDPTPVDPTPVDPTPVDPTPVDPTPVDPTPVDPTPVDPTPVDPTPVDPTPVDPTPVDPTPVDPKPVDPKPVDPKPVDPKPVNPTPAPSNPINSTPPTQKAPQQTSDESVVSNVTKEVTTETLPKTGGGKVNVFLSKEAGNNTPKIAVLLIAVFSLLSISVVGFLTNKKYKTNKGDNK